MNNYYGKGKDMPFHVIQTNGKFVMGFKNSEVAEMFAIVHNRNALDHGRSNRFLAIRKTDTPQEES